MTLDLPGAMQAQAEALQGDEVAAEGGRPWSCLIFVSRKLGVLALDAVLRAMPSLSCFLRSAPFMGQGGTATATSMDSKVHKP